MTSKPRIIVRRGRQEDFVTVAKIEYDEMHPDFYPMFFFKQALSLFGDGFIVSTQSGMVCGYVLVGRHADDDTHAEVYSLVVKSGMRGKGVGRQLMNAALSWARTHHRSIVKLTVSPDNDVAIELYKSLGFQVTNRVKGYYGPREDRILMQHSNLGAT